MESCASLAPALSDSASGECVYNTYTTPAASTRLRSRAASWLRLPFLGRSYDMTGLKASSTPTWGGEGVGCKDVRGLVVIQAQGEVPCMYGVKAQTQSFFVSAGGEGMGAAVMK